MIKKNQLIKETAFYIDCAQKNLNYFDNVTICHCRQEYKKLGELTERNNKEIVESVTLIVSMMMQKILKIVDLKKNRNILGRKLFPLK